MILSIITINRNNAEGLIKTINSVLGQSSLDFEYIIIDGNSSDGSVKVIENAAERTKLKLTWVSEPDNGIYDAMNKGLSMASGDYVQFLNSGDCLASSNVFKAMRKEVDSHQYPAILYGNMIKCFPDGETLKDKSFEGRGLTFLDFYQGTLNHSSAYIRRDLFEKYGAYSTEFKIVSDWEWYLRAIVFGHENVVYTNIDVSNFDMTGISETNKDLEKEERTKVLSWYVDKSILTDYDNWAFKISQMKRIISVPFINKLFWVVERCVFKLEKANQKRTGTISIR